MRSPTQLSLAMLRAEGWTCWVVEHWDSFARKRRDLFGCIDILCLRGWETLAVQTTSASGVSARVKKIEANEHTKAMREADWAIHVHGWSKRKVKRGGKAERWHCRVVDVSLG